VSPRPSLRNSLKWAFVMNWGQRGIATMFTFVLAAILGPRNFGIVAIALIYIVLIQGLLEQGVSTAIIQRQDLEPEHVDSAFWMNLGWCLVLTGASVAASGWWADANNLPELASVIVVLSLIIPIQGLTIVQQALLQRDSRFKEFGVAMNVGALVGGALGVTLALTGAGVWALVAQQLSSEVTALVLMWVVSDWRPRLRFSTSHARSLLGFSTNVFVANMAGFLNRRADALLMGLFFGPVVVGIYRLADRIVDLLLELTMRPVGLVSLPHFSRLQNDPQRLREAVAACLRATFLLTVPALLVLAACSEQLLALLGEEWVPGADALKLLCIVGIAKGLVFFTGPLLFAVARPRFRAIMLWILAVLSAVTVVGVGTALADSSTGDQLFGMALSRAALFVAVFVPVNMVIIWRLTGLSLRDLSPSLPGPILAGIVPLAAVAAISQTGVLDLLAPLPAFALVGSVAVGTSVAVLLLVEPQARAALFGLRHRRSRAAAPPLLSRPGS
jgi:O-antigen/teichoic acid export membrane protein